MNHQKPESKPSKTLSIRPFLFEIIGCSLLLYFGVQTWVGFSGEPGIDYKFYHQAARSIHNHGSPYWDAANYIYPPPLAILLYPFQFLAPSRGYIIWAVFLCIAYIYTIYRSGSAGQRWRE